MDISLMVEGQNGLTWERWSHILALAERLHIPSVFRSDHYFIGEQQDSLEAYLSFVMAASETEHIHFGPLVTPVTFRRPVDIGRMSAQIDALSGGRFVCGLGAGWNEEEHTAYGLPFPAVGERFDRLENAIQLMQALWTQSPATHDGAFFSLKEADCLPRPASGRPPLLLGGTGEKRTLKLVAQYADEWNATRLTVTDLAQKNEVLAAHCENVGRDPGTIRRSMMTFGVIGPQSLID
ncbi:MAG TPA: TIGR03560 family F420-dependent LLM class oxidoreductase, partial [Dehalococcoidia bacterium]|nr:TIGR03560 family F420-dependent LLM class oxidoreductase [Dehalococcoidia bacterium]